MRLNKPVNFKGVTQAFSRSGCPVCILLKNFQATCLDQAAEIEITGLCNFHAWAVAAAARGEAAAVVLERLLKTGSASRECSICERMSREEKVRIGELSAKLTAGGAVADWFSQHGTVCVGHAGMLSPHLNAQKQTELREVVSRNARELMDELRSFAEQKKSGSRAAGGILGRVAEFLVGQRGLHR